MSLENKISCSLAALVWALFRVSTLFIIVSLPKNIYLVTQSPKSDNFFLWYWCYSNRDECEARPCASWHAGAWSSCSANCGPGTRTRIVRCLSDQERVPLPDQNCEESRRPPGNVAGLFHWVWCEKLHMDIVVKAVLRIWIRDPVPFWPLDQGSGIGFFRIPDLGSRIPDPKPIFLRASIILWKLTQIFSSAFQK